MKRIIGITFGMPNNVSALFSNGIRQNVLFLNQTFNLTQHEVYLVTDKPLIPGIPVFDYATYKHISYNSEEYKQIRFDVLIQMGVSFAVHELRRLREQGCKIILYKCGNEYIFDTEHVLFTPRPEAMPQHADAKDTQYLDQVWTIPQMEHSCTDYFAIRYRCPVKIVPFVWNPTLLESMCKPLPNKGVYDANKKKDGWKVAVFEPNMNVVKFSLPCLYVCENAYRRLEDKNQLKNVYITNANAKTKGYGKFNSSQFSRTTYSLDLYKDKKISVESRFNAVVFLNNHADIVVSHQWENPLNYLYLDIAWMGWPLVHNAHLCPDIGYYYEGFHLEEGGKMLQWVMDTHAKVADEYLQRNRQKIRRYISTEPANVRAYEQLIDQLFE